MTYGFMVVSVPIVTVTELDADREEVNLRIKCPAPEVAPSDTASVTSLVRT